jgi:amino acid transporter
MPELSGWASSNSRKERDFAMGTSIGSLPDAAVMIVLITIFAIVLVVAHRALKEMPLFGDGGSWIVAFCTAALSVLGLLRFLGAQEDGARADSRPAAPDGVIDFILLPYATLAIAILFVLLLLALGKVRPSKGRTPGNQQRVELPLEVKRLTEQCQAPHQGKLKKEPPA